MADVSLLADSEECGILVGMVHDCLPPDGACESETLGDEKEAIRGSKVPNTVKMIAAAIDRKYVSGTQKTLRHKDKFENETFEGQMLMLMMGCLRPIHLMGSCSAGGQNKESSSGLCSERYQKSISKNELTIQIGRRIREQFAASARQQGIEGDVNCDFITREFVSKVLGYWARSTDMLFILYATQLHMDRLCEDWRTLVASGFRAKRSTTDQISSIVDSFPSAMLLVIEEVSQVRFLGVTLDRKLNLNLYTQHIVNQCQAIVNLMRHIRGTCWGADQRTMRVIFLSHIVLYITYAAPALLTLSRTSKSKLEVVYNRAVKVMCRTPRNCNPQALQILTGCPLVCLQLLSSSLRYFIRGRFLSDDCVKEYSAITMTFIGHTWYKGIGCTADMTNNASLY
ncbi:hypothetical protein CAPTEDRAFT_188221 [Capitella teleta]|uniref:Uncharacterized protein n=1 Tax=Capitella teleta TaxID=283909 RepID=R7VL27_CAPTE|nr:hypothetical protein CAPTEDRAFT_188221 [Capitella teleta]|eukprot:ELU17245.1 hypothetical protein CAPTEDRAFT_188221 [Capitella teleta]